MLALLVPGVGMGGSAAVPPVGSFVPSAHRTAGVTHPTVPTTRGSGLSMWGWLRPVRIVG